MPAHRRPDREITRSFSVRLPESLILELRLLHCDPTNGRGRYRSFGHLVETIFRDYLDKQKVSLP